MGYDSSGRKTSLDLVEEIRKLWKRNSNRHACYKLANNYFKSGKISQKEFTLLAEEGCLGYELKRQCTLYNKSINKNELNQ